MDVGDAVGLEVGEAAGIGVLGVGDAVGTGAGTGIADTSTNTGEALLAELSHPLALVPSPIWPNQFAPQQYALPPDASPQVWKASSPATRLVNAHPPDTATGVVNWEFVPSPSWPAPLLPQQYALPPETSPQV